MNITTRWPEGKACAEAPEDSLLVDLVDEVIRKLQCGEPVSIDDYRQTHPQQSARLGELWPTLQLMAAMGGQGSAESRGSRVECPGPDAGAESAADAGPRFSTLDSAAPPPAELGDFRILRELGRGGMGIVYEAEQRSLSRCVALKVLPFASVLDARRLQRFRNEALAAAQLDHPHIVDVYGVGCERGVHYYAMRCIDGMTVAELIARLRQRHVADRAPHHESQAAEAMDRRRVDETANAAAASTEATSGSALVDADELRGGYIRAAAELGLNVAEALEHAHQQGVVHRDIKPSNLILDAQDRVWVCDFGLAHVEAGSGLTATGDVLGTLRYMSPEQAFGPRGAVDHRTDIYSLGVTLYELLTLSPLFEGDDRAELLRRMSREEPQPIRKHNPHVPVDLQTILLKAMARNPCERYAAAQELADDLRRFLEDRPILARRPSTAERCAKWLRRHRRVPRTAAALAAFCLVALVCHTVQIAAEKAETTAALNDVVIERNRAAKHQRLAEQRLDEARQSRREAERAADELKAVVQFLTDDLLASAAPSRSLGESLTVADVLETASQKVESAFSDQPLVAASIRQTIGNMYWRLGQFELAEPHLELAVELRRLHLGADHPRTLDAMNNLAAVYFVRHRLDDAEALYETVLDSHRRELDENDVRTLRAVHNWAAVLSSRGRYAEARAIHEQNLAIRRQVLGDEHPETLASMHCLAELLRNEGQWSESRKVYEAALAVERRVVGEDDPMTLGTMAGLARVLFHLGEIDQSLVLREATLKKQRRILGEEHPSTLVSMRNLAVSYAGQHQFEAAESLYRDVLEVQRRTLGADHPSTLATARSLADVYHEQRKLPEARKLAEDTLRRFEHSLGPEHPETLASMVSLAAVCRQLGETQRALELHQRALDGFLRSVGAEHPHTLAALNNVANLLTDADRWCEARPLYQQSLETLRRVLGDDHPQTLVTAYNLAIQLWRQGELIEAARLHEDTLRRRVKVLGEEHPDTRNSMHAHRRVLREMGEAETSMRLLECYQALKERERLSAASSPVAAPRPFVLTRKVPGETTTGRNAVASPTN